MRLKLGSRKSRLAMWQTHKIAALLEAAHPAVTIEIVTMDTLGDKRTDQPMPSIGVKGLFTKELEDALLDDDIDIAVHSLKDLPTNLPDGLIYAGSPGRADPTDAFISTRWKDLSELPDNATIATGSRRRKSQLLSRRPGLQFKDLRGNIDTRLRKLDEYGWDGIIMATAALERLERPELITTRLDPEIFVPAVGQGAIGLETRGERADIKEILAPILDETTVTAVSAERIFLNRLEGGCSVALGAYCYVLDDSTWVFHGWVGSQDGQQMLTERTQGDDPALLANAMTESFIQKGARSILSS
ncbi:MAG: hydroxymethylbilane synthase [Bradymonadaceae bacterium]